MTYQVNFTDGTIETVHNVLFVKIETSEFYNKGYEYLTFKKTEDDFFGGVSYNLSDVLNFTAILE